jgi:hypothetical protein
MSVLEVSIVYATGMDDQLGRLPLLQFRAPLWWPVTWPQAAADPVFLGVNHLGLLIVGPASGFWLLAVLAQAKKVQVW